MVKIIKFDYSYVIHCRFCGRAIRNKYSNRFYCSVDCEIGGMINNGSLFIGHVEENG